MLKRTLGKLLLPRTISAFERGYLAKMNRAALVFFLLHIPLMAIVAAANDLSPLTAALWTALATLGPVLAMRVFENPRHASLVHGFTAMTMGGLLVHFGQGPVQIEMHFYFFAALAMLAVFANPMVILLAAGTVAAHHLLLWFLLPKSVFNYEAPVWVVAVHAGFVLLEAAAACFIARSFFDNVIGLERKVLERTAQLDARNRDLHAVLDHIGQGLVMIDLDGKPAADRSATLEAWLGPIGADETLPAWLRKIAPRTADMMALGLDELREGLMPAELTLDQLPRRLEAAGKSLALAYTPIRKGEEIEKLLVVVTDITAQLASERLEIEQREQAQLVDRLLRDRGALVEFLDEATGQVDVACAPSSDLVDVRRALHTLKGNAAFFGIGGLSDLCHRLETRIEETGDAPNAAESSELAERFKRMRERVELFLGSRPDALEISSADIADLERDIALQASHRQLAERVAGWRLEPAARRLGRIAEQVHRFAGRLGKGDVEVRSDGNGVRLDAAEWRSFWASFVHLVKNAVDHGLEAPERRAENGKPRQGHVEVSTRLVGSELLVEIADDGRGIDWKAVTRKAADLGLPHGNDRDLTEALFANGVSTKDEVTEMSGRGIGLGAVRAECEARGGRMDIVSAIGVGTRVRFRFPAPTSQRPTSTRQAALAAPAA
jgi:two-component system chemotaxis sensor kinase CheA